MRSRCARPHPRAQHWPAGAVPGVAGRGKAGPRCDRGLCSTQSRGAAGDPRVAVSDLGGLSAANGSLAPHRRPCSGTDASPGEHHLAGREGVGVPDAREGGATPKPPPEGVMRLSPLTCRLLLPQRRGQAGQGVPAVPGCRKSRPGCRGAVRAGWGSRGCREGRPRVPRPRGTAGPTGPWSWGAACRGPPHSRL